MKVQSITAEHALLPAVLMQPDRIMTGQQLDRPGTPGGTTCGGNRTHFLEPFTTAFQAEVALGSLWKEDPDLAGPMISHLKSGRPDSPRTEKRSSANC